jgi:hypothetical protein
MDAGLSNRMSEALGEASSRSVASHASEDAIDLSLAYNAMPYKELSEFFKTTVESQLSTKVGGFLRAIDM